MMRVRSETRSGPTLRSTAGAVARTLSLVSLLCVSSAGCSSSDFAVAAPTDSSAGDDTAAASVDAMGDSALGDTPAGDGTAIDAPEGGADALLDATPPVDTARVCDPASFPLFDRSCERNEDCAFGLHQLDCCGSLGALGIRAPQKATFDAAEADYRLACPLCGCARQPTITDSLDTTSDDSTIDVRCQSKRCTSFVRR